MSKTLVWAHRGASGYAPENTMASFQKAAEMGADGLELDIQLSKDGEIVVIHDETIDRTSNGSGWVKDLTLAELKSFDYNYQNGMNIGGINSGTSEKRELKKVYPEYDFSEIPTMREVFELIAPTDLTINIEVKTGVVFYPRIEEKILAMVRDFSMEDRVIYSSFNHSTVVRIKELNPDAEVGFLYADGPIGVVEYAKKHGVDALHPALYNLRYPDFVKDCKESGIKIHTWTVNEASYMKMCLQYGIEAIITNYPDVARGIAG